MLNKIDNLRQEMNSLNDISREIRKYIMDTKLNVRGVIKEINQQMAELKQYISDLDSMEIDDYDLIEYRKILNNYKGSLQHSRKSDTDDELIFKGIRNLRISFITTRAKMIDIFEPFGKIKDKEYQDRYKEVQKAINVITKFYLDATK